MVPEGPGVSKVRSVRRIDLDPDLVEFVPRVLMKVYWYDLEDRGPGSVHNERTDQMDPSASLARHSLGSPPAAAAQVRV